MKLLSASALLLLSSFCYLSEHNVVNAASLKTYPLVPHHVQRMRMLEENRRLEAVSNASKRPFDAAEAEESEAAKNIRRRAIAQQVGALYQGYGTHYVDLWCGSPPQRQTVIVDTGSGMTAFPCSGCKQCGVPQYHVDKLFVEADSSSFKENSCSAGCKTSRGSCRGAKCQISMGYAEGSRWDAYEAIDKCYIGGPHETPLMGEGGTTDDIDPNHAGAMAFDLVFGCQTYLTGLFKTQLADGIMGMDNKKEAFWSQMFNAGKMGTEKLFALCFARQPTAERKGTESGAMTLGGADQRLHSTPMVYSSNASKGRGGFFSTRVRSIYLRDGTAGESVQSKLPNPTDGVTKLSIDETTLNQGGVIVDSGTTDTYWNKALSSVFSTAFSQVTGGKRHSNSAQSMTEAEMLALPTILFQLEANPTENAGMDPSTTPGLAGTLDPTHPNDIIVAFPPSHYMEYDADKNMYTSRFYLTENGGSVLGGNAMMGHDVLFDVDNDRIGWAESDCDYTNLVTTNGYTFDITGTLQEAAAGSAGSSETPGSIDNGGIIVGPTAPTLINGVVPVAVPTLPPFPAPTLPVAAPTLPPVAAPTLPPAAAPTLPPVAAPTLPPVAFVQPTLPPVAVVEQPVVAPVAPPVASPVEMPVTTPTATETAATHTHLPVEVTHVECGEDCSKFKNFMYAVWNIILDGYAFAAEATNKFLDVCDTPECQYPVGIGLAISLVAGCCFSCCCSCLYRCFCCCCRKKKATGPKYQTVSAGDDEDDDEHGVEMVNGGHFSSYKDDPLSNGSSKGGFKDNPEANGNGSSRKPPRSKGKKGAPKSRKPEFQGDFI